MSEQAIKIVDVTDEINSAAVPALVALCSVDDIQSGDIRQAVLACGHKLAIYNVDGEFYVTDDTCSHGDASLSEDGVLEGAQVECTWHFGRFDVRTGEACAMPCTHPLRTWPVHVEDGKVWVDTAVRR